MGWSIAGLWNTTQAYDIAGEISNISGLYCGPTVVGWIAAIWNLNKGRSYDYNNRLRDKQLFPDGPRMFFGEAPGFQASLYSILRRETEDELSLSDNTYYKYGTIHDALGDYDMPIIIRMKAPEFLDGLHYATLYKSEQRKHDWNLGRIQFYWQDNGTYGSSDGGNQRLYKTEWRNVGLNRFVWGAKRVVQ